MQTKIFWLQLLQSVSHIIAVNRTHGIESKKKYTDETKLNPAAPDDIRAADER